MPFDPEFYFKEFEIINTVILRATCTRMFTVEFVTIAPN